VISALLSDKRFLSKKTQLLTHAKWNKATKRKWIKEETRLRGWGSLGRVRLAETTPRGGRDREGRRGICDETGMEQRPILEPFQIIYTHTRGKREMCGDATKTADGERKGDPNR